jgi:hypothetical protein
MGSTIECASCRNLLFLMLLFKVQFLLHLQLKPSEAHISFVLSLWNADTPEVTTTVCAYSPPRDKKSMLSVWNYIECSILQFLSFRNIFC